MSADDGLHVDRVDGESNLYGVFHYFASSDGYFGRRREDAQKLFSHPVAAILGAFRMEAQTEYGVSVDRTVMDDCSNMFADSGWLVKK